MYLRKKCQDCEHSFIGESMYLVNNVSNKSVDLSHLMQLVGVLKTPLSPLRT